MDSREFYTYPNDYCLYSFVTACLLVFCNVFGKVGLVPLEESTCVRSRFINKVETTDSLEEIWGTDRHV